MSVLTAPDVQALPLVDIIDFKWLMAGAGLSVHVERMQVDPSYACACLARGAASKVTLLHDTALRLAHTLGVTLPSH